MEILTTKEVAKLVHSDVRTIQKKAESGYYPKNVCGRHGRYWLFNKENSLLILIKLIKSICYTIIKSMSIFSCNIQIRMV